MKWSFLIGRISGIDIRVHATFFLLLAWIGISSFAQEQSIQEVFRSMGFILLLFTIVVLHEFGHALMARRFGVKTYDITLLPIGGVARLERMPERPLHEFLVAIAGPTVNVVLAAILAVILWGAKTPMTPESLQVESPLLVQLLWINVALATFNMLPAFPMDGGRALRALLAMRTDPVKATQIAATIGQGLAVLLAVAGFFESPVFLLIAVFIWFGAGAESKHAQMKSVLDGIPVGYAMVTRAKALAPTDTLAKAAEMSLHGGQADFAVVDRDQVIGLLTRTKLIQGIAEHGAQATVSQVAELNVNPCHPYDMLDRTLPKLEQAPQQCMAVTWDDGSLAGLLTLDGVGELVAIRSALAARGHEPTKGRPWRLATTAPQQPKRP